MKSGTSLLTNEKVVEELCSVLNECSEMFSPPPDESVSDWSPKNIKMSTEHDSIGGPYNPFAYQKEILNSSTNLKVREIVLMTSAQVGKTWSMLIIAAHRITTKPSGIVWAMDTDENVKFHSGTRFDPMVNESKTLSKLVFKKTYKSQKNKTLLKKFPGGWLRFVTAGSAGGLSSAATPLAFGDEIDKWKATKNEGNPLNRLRARMKMQVNPLLVVASTPTIKGESAIEARYEESDKRRYHVQCCHCGKEQILIFDNIEWESKEYNSSEIFESEKEKLLNAGVKFRESKTKKNKLHFPETAHYACKECGSVITDYEKNKMVISGRWIAERPFMGRAGFHLNELYSPNRTFSDIVDDYLSMKDNPKDMQSFTNESLGKTYEVPHEAMESSELVKRRETYYKAGWDKDSESATPPLLPARGGILTAGVDVQINRLEVTVRLWGLYEESWGIEYLILYGDPFEDAVWKQLDSIIDKQYKHPLGMKLKISKCAIDQGYATGRVYKYVHKRKWPAVAVKGKGGPGEPVHNGTPSYANKNKVPVYNIGINDIKSSLYSRSFKDEPGPGMMHWNKNYDERYFKHFTAEKRIKTTNKSGNIVRQWVCPSGKENHALDCEVYAYAALHLIGMGDIDAAIKRIIDPPKPEEEKEPAPREPNEFTDDL